MTTYGDTFFVKKLYVDGKEVKGTPGGFQTLEETLTAGDDANGLDINNVGTLTTAAAGPGVLAKQSDIKADVIETRFVNSTNCNTVELRASSLAAIAPAVLDITCQNITSTGTINYTAFNPPLSSVGTPSLSATMSVDNSVGLIDLNMNGRDIQNVNNIGIDGTASCATMQCTQGQVIAGALLGNASLDLNNTDASTSVKLDFTGVAGAAADTFIEGDSSLNSGQPKRTVCTYLDLTDSTNTFPASAAGDLAATLALGNSAGTYSIDMNNQQINNALSVGATAMQAVQVSVTGALNASAATITGDTNPNTGFLNLNAATGGTAKLDFTGVTNQAQDTEIEGDDTQFNGQPKRTKCTYLDLTDSTNLFRPSDNEIYEWGAHWLTPISLGSGGVQRGYVFFGSNEDSSPQGWRFVQAMSDGSSDFTEKIYEYAAGNKPFYAKTASTTIPAHASQVIEFTYPVTGYGYGRVFWGLYYSLDNDAATKTFLPYSGRNFLENITGGGVQAAAIRKGGYVTMKWVMKNAFPIDGTVWRIYPVFRTDTGAARGRFESYIGNGVPVKPYILDWDNGDSTDFGNGMNGQVILRGYPLPANWVEFSGI